MLSLWSFVRRYPDTLIFGGSSALSLLGSRRKSLPQGFYSQCGQDALLLNHFYKLITKPGFPKTFVDVGCNHPTKHNNSCFFERHMGFKVLGVDALPVHQQAWTDQRPETELVITAVGKEEGTVEFEEVAQLKGNQNDMLSSVRGASSKAKSLDRRIVNVPVTTLTHILRSRQCFSVGIMSIDIEGYEMQALLGLDFQAIKINIIILENNTGSVFGDDKIRVYLIENGFRYFARIWGMDDVFVMPDMVQET